jgi:uncharacterized protein YndB with AHSA1/START domain
MEMTKNELKVTLPSDTEILLTREFDAPRELVWEACTKPEYVKQWWGPHGTELIECEIDFRVGGGWRYVTRDQDGNVAPFRGEYREIQKPEKIVQTFIFDVPPFDQYIAVENWTLEEKDGRTYCSTLVQHDSKEARDGQVESGMEGGAAEAMDRLEALLKTLKK